MKKIVLIIVLVAGFNTVKAQQLIPVKPNLKLTDSLNFFKPDTYPSPKSFLLQPAATVNSKNTMVVYSRMPVLSVTSNDRMPMAGMRQATNQDNMPVLKIVTADPLANNKQPAP